MTGEELRFVAVAQGDALAGPLLAELAAEYSQRYGGTEEAQLRSLRDHPADDFAPPWGGLFIGVGADGTPLTGGAFRTSPPPERYAVGENVSGLKSCTPT